MKFYLSGVSGKEEYDVIKGVTAPITPSIMVDQFDLQLMLKKGWEGSVAIDCGGYRLKRKGGTLIAADYLERLTAARDANLLVDFAVALDDLDDPEQTERWWLETKDWQEQLPFPYIPVWQWGTDETILVRYLDECAIVAIGRLVPLMRSKDRLMLKRLLALCQKYPGRFHILGCNWLKALQKIAPFVYSVDTSKAWDAGRYGSIIFVHKKHQTLQQANYKLIPDYVHLSDRQERMTACVETLHWFAFAERLRRQRSLQLGFVKVLGKTDWLIHKGGVSHPCGGMIGQLTQIQVGGETGYVRENVRREKDSFYMSANERLAWKRGFIPKPSQQILELCAPKGRWRQFVQTVHLQEADDALWNRPFCSESENLYRGTPPALPPLTFPRPIFKNQRFSRRWAAAAMDWDGEVVTRRQRAA